MTKKKKEMKIEKVICKDKDFCKWPKDEERVISEIQRYVKNKLGEEREKILKFIQEFEAEQQEPQNILASIKNYLKYKI